MVDSCYTLFDKRLFVRSQPMSMSLHKTGELRGRLGGVGGGGGEGGGRAELETGKRV